MLLMVPVLIALICLTINSKLLSNLWVVKRHYIVVAAHMSLFTDWPKLCLWEYRYHATK